MRRVYISVIAKHDIDGNIYPLSLKWEDGRVFSVDKILDVRQAAALKAGGQGMRYTCRICGKQICLFCDEGRWFIES